jgi:hypothetical protein
MSGSFDAVGRLSRRQAAHRLGIGTATLDRLVAAEARRRDGGTRGAA